LQDATQGQLQEEDQRITLQDATQGQLQEEDQRIKLQDATPRTASGRRPKDYVAGRDTRNIFRKKTKGLSCRMRHKGQLQEEDQRITLQDATQGQLQEEDQRIKLQDATQK